jgi:hypothetical protein
VSLPHAEVVAAAMSDTMMARLNTLDSKVHGLRTVRRRIYDAHVI